RSMYNLEATLLEGLRKSVNDAAQIFNRSLYITSGSSVRAVIKGQVENLYEIYPFIQKITPQLGGVSAVTETMLVANREPRLSSVIDFQKAEAFVAYREFRRIIPGAWLLPLGEQRKLEGMFVGVRDKLSSDKGGVLTCLLKAK